MKDPRKCMEKKKPHILPEKLYLETYLAFITYAYIQSWGRKRRKNKFKKYKIHS